jgi:3-methyladenine DNA glycosylase AlkD
MTKKEVIAFLEKNGSAKNVLGMARFGIRPKTKVYGVSVTTLRSLAKKIKKDNLLAEELYKTKIHECRILASIIADPSKFTSKKMDVWTKDFDSWDICDLTCMNIFRYQPLAIKKCLQWSKEKEEYYKRAGFALMAALASDKKNKIPDTIFETFFPIIMKNAKDERNFVKKAVNWALRQIGKRNKNLNKKAIKVAKKIIELDTPSARFIGGNAWRELKAKSQLN